MADAGRVTISYTEFPQFVRLVEFLTDVNALASDDDIDHDDEGLATALRELVDRCRRDMASYGA